MPLLALALLTPAVAAQIPVLNSGATQEFLAYDDAAQVFEISKTFQGPNTNADPYDTLWIESFDEFALAAGNAFGGSAFQRIVIDPDLATGRTTLLQGSAALAGTVLNSNPISARVEASSGLIFTLSQTTTVRLIYDLEGRANLDQQIPGFDTLAWFSLADTNAPLGELVLSRAVGTGEIDTGVIDLDLGPGDYALDAGAGAFLVQSPDFQSGSYLLPDDPQRAGGYSVSLAIIPTPTTLTLAAVGGLALIAPRRRPNH
ncbi:MAG: hypothetical protein ACF8Q5_01560 [Phycisphaerales bacterium JB040]